MLSRREFLVAATVAGTATACGLLGGSDHRRVEYGDAPSQFGHLYVPKGRSRGTVVLVHGGSWAADQDLSLLAPVAKDLKQQGYVVWNVEYRRLGQPGGGWPGTFEDVGSAVDALTDLTADESKVDPHRAVVVGHSAGGTLALWAGARDDATVRPVGLVSLAGVTDLVACVEENLLDGACSNLMGGSPEVVGQDYRQASPIDLVPIGLPQAVLHGQDDDIVPVRQSQDYVTRATGTGDTATFVGIPDAGHFQLIDVGHPAYHEAVTAIGNLLDGRQVT